MQVRCEDAGILEDGTILDDGLRRLWDLNDFLESLVQEVDLRVERPPLHVGIEVGEIRVVVDGLEPWGPAVTLGKQSRERGLAASDVSCYGYMHNTSK